MIFFIVIYRCLECLYRTQVFKRCCPFQKDLYAEIAGTLRVSIKLMIIIDTIFFNCKTVEGRRSMK